MPYIPKNKREEICCVDDMTGPGDLNYLLTSWIHEYLKYKGVSYAMINEVIGVLECAKIELYRQIASPYEDKKKQENGSVSELDSEGVG